MKTKNNLMVAMGLMLLFVHCGGGGSDSAQKSPPGVPLPKELQGIADIKAYVFPSQDPDNRAEMTFDAATQTYRGTIVLERGSKTDLTIVYYVDQGGEEIQVAHYKRPEVFVAGDSMEVNYAGDEANWQISFDLTPGTPNALNLDGDAFSNLVEVGYGSDPQLATSLPEGPTVTATRKDPLGGDFDIGLPPPGADLAASLTGIVEITLNADTPFELKSFGMELPSFGMERVTPLAEVLSTGEMTIRLHTDLLVVNGKDDVELRFKAVDVFGIEKTTIIPVSIQNGPDNSPPVRLELGITDGQTLINENVIFVWELGDGSGIDDATISAVLESKSNGVLLAYQLTDENPSDDRHFRQTMIFNAADYPNGEYTFLFKAKDKAGRAYSETITLTVNNADAVEQIGANPKVKLGGQIMLGPIPEATAEGVQNVVTLDGSQSLAPANATINYLWSCLADGFTFTSSKVVDSFTLRNITREEDGYAIACTLTISQGANYKDTEVVGITVAFVNQSPVVSTFTLNPKSGLIPTPDNFVLNWAASDADGANDLAGYDLAISRTKHDGTNQPVITCTGIPANVTSISSNSDLMSISDDCTLHVKDHGEKDSPSFYLGAMRDYDIVLTAIDQGGATGSGSVSPAIHDSGIQARYTFEDTLNDARGTRHGTLYDNTVQSAATYVDSGNSVMNRVIQFDKTKKQQVRQSNAYTLRGNDFTLSAWVKPQDFQEVQVIIASVSGLEGYEWVITRNATLYFDSVTCALETSVNNLTSGQWNHVVVTRKAGSIRHYVNGELAGASTCLKDLYTESDVMIGCNGTVASNISCTKPFSGEMDEVAMWNRALDVDEVRRLCRANDPTGAMCTNNRTPIILEPTPGAVLPPTSAFWSWRGERDVEQQPLNSGVQYSAMVDRYTPGPDKFESIPATEIHQQDDLNYYHEDLSDKVDWGFRMHIFSQDEPQIINHRTFSAGSQMAAWYKFEGNGTDSSGSGNTGTFVNGSTFSSTWPDLGQVLWLDGQNDRFEVNDSSNLDFSNQDFTIAAFTRSNTSNKTQSIVIKKDGVQGFELIQTNTNELMLNVNGCISEAGLLFANQWHHVGSTRHTQTVNGIITGIMRIYVDGEIVLQNQCSGNVYALNVNNSNKMVIGGDAPGHAENYYFNGFIDDVILKAGQFSGPAIKNQFCALKAMMDDLPDSCL